MKLKKILCCLLLFSFIQAASQNLVPNSSFENGSSAPTGPGLVNNLNNWITLNSSEWHYESTYIGEVRTSGDGLCSPYVSGILNAHTGQGYIGFGSCEGAQVELTSKTKTKDYFTTISFWWTPMHQEDTEINIYLLEDQAPEDALDVSSGTSICSNPNIDEDFRLVIPVNSGGPDAVHFPGTWYHFQSQPMIIRDKEYEWLLIKGEKAFGAQNSCNYMFVDDVTVECTPVCGNICTPKEKVSFEQIQGQPNVLANAIRGNSVENWFMIVKNATEIEFRIFSNASQEFFTYLAYDPNGLKDPGYSDYLFEWNGEDNNGNTVQEGLYNFNLKIKNCNSQIINVAKPLFIFPAQSAPIRNYPTQQNLLENCCKPNATFDNITFQNGFREDVDDFINAGTGTGNVIVPESSSVRFHAGNKIILGSGFQALGDFVAEIVPCGIVRQKSSSRGRELISQSDLDNLVNELEGNLKVNSNLKIDVIPNPNKGKFTIVINNSNDVSLIEVTNMMGKLVFHKKTIRNSINMNISDEAKGIYLIKIINGNSVVTQKIVLE